MNATTTTTTTTTDYVMPCVHLNGTSASDLLDAIESSYMALREAYETLKKGAPNARDYYPLGNDAYPAARAQHMTRLQRVHDCMEELEREALHIQAVNRR